MNRLALLTSMLLIVAPLSAQDVKFRGELQDGSGIGPCYYCPGSDFVLKFTHSTLSSSTIALAPFVGQQVSGIAHWDGSNSAPKLDVTSIQLAPESFSIGGTGALNTVVKFTAVGSPGDGAFILIAAADGFAAVNGYGALFLSTAPIMVLGQGTVGNDGEFQIKATIPNDPTLVGVKVFGQGGIVSQDGTHFFTNSDLLTIS